MNYQDYNELTIQHQFYKGKEIIDVCKNSTEKHLQQLGDFMTDWLDDSPTITVKTSGSTGVPKLIEVEKNQMLASAAMTVDYFKLKEGNTVALCLSIDFIAGKMMVVRALYGKLNLLMIAPSSQPLAAIPNDVEIDFIPLTPMQMSGSSPKKSIKKILLGGAPLTKEIELLVQDTTTEVFHSYGMTETLSHVAIRKVNHKDKSNSYHALKGIFFETNEQGVLVISVPFLTKKIITTDVVDLMSNTEFVWKGRLDHVINSGGLKFFPEEIEKKLSPFIRDDFFIAGLPDDVLGEKIVLLVESVESEKYRERLKKICVEQLLKHEQPKEIYCIEKFLRTTSHKIKRSEAVNLMGNN